MLAKKVQIAGIFSYYLNSHHILISFFPIFSSSYYLSLPRRFLTSGNSLFPTTTNNEETLSLVRKAICCLCEIVTGKLVLFPINMENLYLVFPWKHRFPSCKQHTRGRTLTISLILHLIYLSMFLDNKFNFISLINDGVCGDQNLSEDPYSPSQMP